MVSPIGSSSAPPAADKLRAQAEDLEGVFLTTLVKEMFATVGKDNGFGGGFAEETWRGMQAENYASALAKNGGIGLADALVRDLLTVQQSLPQQTSFFQGAYK